jgi:hypothetical protein
MHVVQCATGRNGNVEINPLLAIFMRAIATKAAIHRSGKVSTGEGIDARK